MSEQIPFLSIVIPALNEEHRLPPTLTTIATFLAEQDYTAEVIVVDNGSSDDTVGVVRRYAEAYPYMRVISLNERGKGLAVKAGMLDAGGEYRFICDADLSMPIQELTKFLPPNHTGRDVVIGSREGEGARRIGEPEFRHIMGRVLTWIVKLTLLADFEDTQCGFKLFTGEVAEDLFSVQRMNGIGFDVELLYIAKQRGYSVVDQPITWHYDPDSRMRFLQDSLHILIEIWQIRQNWRNGIYARRDTPQGQNSQSYAGKETL